MGLGSLKRMALVLTACVVWTSALGGVAQRRTGLRERVRAPSDKVSPTERRHDHREQLPPELVRSVLTGTNFVAGASASFSGAGITVNSTTVDSATQATVSVTLDAVAATGAREITWNNNDGSSAGVTHGAKRSIRGLSDAVHTMKIVVLGKRRAASTGTTIGVDRWVVL